MDWLKLRTNLLLQRLRDDELIAIVKYELLWALFEERPDDKTASRYMTPTQLRKALAYSTRIQCDMDAQLQRLKNKRSADKSLYRKNKDLQDDSDVGPTPDRHRTDTGPTHQKRGEERRIDEKKESLKENASCDALVQKNSKPKKVFVKPTLNEICDEYYVRTNEVHTDAECVEFAERFLAHYDSVDWKVGKNPMKDWRACVRTWIHNEKNFK